MQQVVASDHTHRVQLPFEREEVIYCEKFHIMGLDTIVFFPIEGRLLGRDIQAVR